MALWRGFGRGRESDLLAENRRAGWSKPSLKLLAAAEEMNAPGIDEKRAGERASS
jgi:hypothetical protein